MVARLAIALILTFFSIAAHAGTGFRNEDGPKSRLIVFVNGVLSNDKGTWTNPKTNAFFPDLVAADDRFDDFDVFVFDLLSDLTNKSPSVHALVDQLHSKLVKNGLDRYKSILFVGHSLGGIVIRQFIVSHPEFNSAVDGMLLFGTPSGGSYWADRFHWMFNSVTIEELRTIEDGEVYLSQLQDDWIRADLGGTIKSFCVAETRDSYPLVRIVERRNTRDLCSADFVDLDGFDHHALAKPRGVDGLPYLELLKVAAKLYRDFSVNVASGSDVVLAHCKPDEYGSEIWDGFTERLNLTRIGTRIVTFHESKELEVDWSDNQRSLLWQRKAPKVIVIHYSCFQQGKEGDKAARRERSDDFARFLTSIKDTDIRVVAYTNGYDGSDKSRRTLRAFTFEGFPGLAKAFPDKKRLFFVRVPKGEAPTQDVFDNFQAALATAVK